MGVSHRIVAVLREALVEFIVFLVGDVRRSEDILLINREFMT